MGVYEIRDYILAVIIFVIFILAGISLIRVFVDNDHGNFIDTSKVNEFEDVFNKSQSILDQTDKLESRMKNASTDFGTFGVLNALVSTTWQGLKITTDSFSFMRTVFYGPSKFFNIPVWLLALIYAMIIVIIIYAVIDAIYGGTGR